MSTGRQRREVTYAGHVQGVGFRYSTYHIAQRHDVVGYVRNLADGRVELVAEGAASVLDDFLAEVAESMSGYIRSAKTHSSPATGQFGEFGIRHG